MNKKYVTAYLLFFIDLGILLTVNWSKQQQPRLSSKLVGVAICIPLNHSMQPYTKSTSILRYFKFYWSRRTKILMLSLKIIRNFSVNASTNEHAAFSTVLIYLCLFISCCRVVTGEIAILWKRWLTINIIWDFLESIFKTPMWIKQNHFSTVGKIEGSFYHNVSQL
jgi:hypothetical protein